MILNESNSLSAIYAHVSKAQWTRKYSHDRLNTLTLLNLIYVSVDQISKEIRTENSVNNACNVGIAH